MEASTFKARGPSGDPFPGWLRAAYGSGADASGSEPVEDGIPGVDLVDHGQGCYAEAAHYHDNELLTVRDPETSIFAHFFTPQTIIRFQSRPLG